VAAGVAAAPMTCVCVLQLEESKRTVNSIRRLVEEDEGEEEVEKVSWNGEPVGCKALLWLLKQRMLCPDWLQG